MFYIKIHDFYFHEDTVLTFDWPESMSITVYDPISGEELSPYRRLTAGYIKTFISLCHLLVGFTIYKLQVGC